MDQTIKCCDCGNDFIWPQLDQEYYKDRGFDPPKRCKSCRFKKKQRFENKERYPKREYPTEE